MKDVHLFELAGRQFNRISRAQLRDLGFSDDAIGHRVATGRLVPTEQGVFAAAPLLEDDRGRFMGATLTAPDTFLSHVSGGAAYGFWTRERDFETVTRPGTGGPRRHGDVLVFHSQTLAGESTLLGPIPILRPERVLVDLAAHVGESPLARALREAVRLQVTSLESVVDALARHRGRRGTVRLSRAASRYSGLPIARARSGAEVRALLVLRDAGREMPNLNRKVSGIEADLSWPRRRLIIELDGLPFHLDIGEDERKQRTWEEAGWEVRRLPSDVVYEAPELLLAAAPPRERA